MDLNDVYYEFYYLTVDDAVVKAVEVTDDNGFVVLYEFYLLEDVPWPGMYLPCIGLIKFNSLGVVEWSRMLSNHEDLSNWPACEEFWDTAECMAKTSDGGFVVHILSDYIPDEFGLLKLDSMGNFQWFKNLVGSGIIYLFGIEQTSNDEYYAVGEEDREYKLLKFNSEGDTLWTKAYTTPNSIRKLNDIELNEFDLPIISGFNYDSEEYHLFSFSTTENGDIEWVVLDTLTYQIVCSSIYKKSGLYYVTGDQFAFIRGIGTSIINEEGEVLDNNFFVTPDLEVHNCTSLIVDNNNDYVFTSAYGDNIEITKLDENFNAIWQQSLRGALGYGPNTLQLTEDNHYVTAKVANESLLILTKMDGNGDFTDSDEEVIIKQDFKLTNYPNPYNPSGIGRSSTTTISYSIIKRSKVKLSVLNIKGQVVKTLQDEEQDTGSYSVLWDGEDYTFIKQP